jgi:hypothetical protein
MLLVSVLELKKKSDVSGNYFGNSEKFRLVKGTEGKGSVDGLLSSS